MVKIKAAGTSRKREPAKKRLPGHPGSLFRFVLRQRQAYLCFLAKARARSVMQS
jgi:hypothetical protein